MIIFTYRKACGDKNQNKTELFISKYREIQEKIREKLQERIRRKLKIRIRESLK